MAQPTLSIVRIEEKHVPGLHHCVQSLSRELGYAAVMYVPSIEETRQQVIYGVQLGTPRFAALADGRLLVGWCEILRDQHEAFAHSGRLSIGILKEFRRKGLGRQLIEACLHQAKVLGLHRVDLQVFASNFPAIALYESTGFVREGLQRDAVKANGTYQDVVIMANLLPAERG